MGHLESEQGLAPRARRYSLELPLELPLEPFPLRGLTRDISISGVRFETSDPAATVLRVGDRLDLVLLFPSTVYGRSYRLNVEGRVVRIERTGVGSIIALSTAEFVFGQAGDRR